MVRLKELGKLKKFSDLLGTQTRDLPACNIAPQPSMLPRTPVTIIALIIIIKSIFVLSYIHYLV
jgi:hypothetical protein